MLGKSNSVSCGSQGTDLTQALRFTPGHYWEEAGRRDHLTLFFNYIFKEEEAILGRQPQVAATELGFLWLIALASDGPLEASQPPNREAYWSEVIKVHVWARVPIQEGAKKIRRSK